MDGPAAPSPPSRSERAARCGADPAGQGRRGQRGRAGLPSTLRYGAASQTLLFAAALRGTHAFRVVVAPVAVGRAAGREPGASINSSQRSPKSCSKDCGWLKGVCTARATEILRELCPGGGDLKNLADFTVLVLPEDIVHCVTVASECVV